MKIKPTLTLCATIVMISGFYNPFVLASDRAVAQLETETALAEISYVSNNRIHIITDIITQWSTEMGQNEGWEQEFTASLSSTTDQQLLDIQSAASYSTIQAILQGQKSPVTIEAIAGVASIETLSAVSEDLVYTPVVPCRFFDTRVISGLPAQGSNPGTVQDYYVHGTGSTMSAQGGNSAGCTSPRGEPSAIAANFTVVPYGKGHIRVWPYSEEQPNVSFLNYNSTVDSNLANAGIISTCYSCGPDISVSTWYGEADSLADVTGYFYPSAASGSQIETTQGGYDLEDNTAVAGTGQDYFLDGINASTFIGAFNGNTTLSFSGGETATLRASGSIVNFENTGATIDGTYIACYQDASGNLGQMRDSNTSYANKSPFCSTLNTSGHGGTVVVSGKVSSMPAGTYTFGICALSGGNTQCSSAANPHPGYSSIATKIEVTKY